MKGCFVTQQQIYNYLSKIFFPFLRLLTMPEELDKYLSQIKEQKKVVTAEQRELRKKQRAFISAFRKALSEIVHPAMMEIVDKLRKNGHSSKMLRETKTMQYNYEKYSICASGTGKHVVVVIFGNYHLLKVCITAEYFEYVSLEKKDKSIKQTEQQYELSEITSALLDALVINLMKEMIPAQ